MPRCPRPPQMTIQQDKERFDFLSAAFALTPEEWARDYANRATLKLKRLEAMSSENTIEDGAEDGANTGAEDEATTVASINKKAASEETASHSSTSTQTSEEEQATNAKWKIDNGWSEEMDPVSRSLLSHLRGKNLKIWLWGSFNSSFPRYLICRD